MFISIALGSVFLVESSDIARNIQIANKPEKMETRVV